MASYVRLRAMALHYVKAETSEQEELLGQAMCLSHEDYGVFARLVLQYAHGKKIERPPAERHEIIYIQ